MNGRTKKRPQEPDRVIFNPPALFVRFQRPGLGARIRRLGDIAAACLLIAFTLPLMAIIALAIKCDSPGPLFERKWRIGTGGRRFDELSFRTTSHAENAELPWHRASMTRLGPYLQYTGIDVLPQLFNVLRGEMSITDIGAYEFLFLG